MTRRSTPNRFDDTLVTNVLQICVVSALFGSRDVAV